MPRDVTTIELVEIRTRDDNPQQVREFNYIFQYSAIDTETGALIADSEYRTVASDVPLNLDEARAKITDLIETEQT
jgi:hypothetical protein